MHRESRLWFAVCASDPVFWMPGVLEFLMAQRSRDCCPVPSFGSGEIELRGQRPACRVQGAGCGVLSCPGVGGECPVQIHVPCCIQTSRT